MDLHNLPVGEGVRRRLEASLTRLSHAYMISGPSDRVNRALAGQLAAAYVCSAQADKPCGLCPNCKKAANGIHPDIIRLQAAEDKQSISVEQVRQMRTDAYIRPNEADRKVFIIEGGQLANKDGAQNALLKILEDGPPYLAFLFLVEQPGQLLATIRSRCETLSLIAGEEEPAKISGEIRQAGEEMAALLLDGEERKLMELAASLEQKKWSRDDLRDFFTAVEEALRTQLPARPAQVSGVLEHLKQIRAAVPLNVGAGHLLGWLAAGR